MAEETGRAVAPVPYLGSAVVATTAVLSAGDEGLLSGLAAGTVTAALAVPFASRPGDTGRPGGAPGQNASPAATVRIAPPRAGDPAGQARLTGVVTGVADALPASVLLVPADGVPAGLYAVEAGAPGLTVTPVVSLDQTRPLADLTLDGCPPGGWPLAGTRTARSRPRWPPGPRCWPPSSSGWRSAAWR